MKQKSYLSVIIIFILAYSNGICQRNNIYKLEKIIYNSYPKAIKYDTLDAIFYYENLIESYDVGDAMLQNHGFVEADTILNKSSYLNGYINCNLDYLRNLKLHNNLIQFDSFVNRFLISIYSKSILNGSLNNETKLSPFCGSYYKKYHLKIEVLYIGSILQRVPLFLSCEELKKFHIKHPKKLYNVFKLPTYAVTKVFSWEEIN